MREDDQTLPQPPHHTGIVEGEALTVAADENGLRLDRFLATRLQHMSRARITALIKAGHVVGLDPNAEASLEPSSKVRQDETYRLDEPEPIAAEPAPQDIPLSIVFEDDALIVIDKPAGLVVHPGAGNADGTLVNALLAHCGSSLSGIGGVRRPGIVHRLDKDTSGLLVVAKTDVAHHGLASQFQAHGRDGRLERTYIAYVWGNLLQPTGHIDAPLGRKPNNRTKMAVVSANIGRSAVTHYQVCAHFNGQNKKALVARINCQLETGRTHQIRVHLAHIGHPVLGDTAYGSSFNTQAKHLHPEAQAALTALKRQALHAAVLAFEHPITGEPLRFESEMPDDMSTLHHALARH